MAYALNGEAGAGGANGGRVSNLTCSPMLDDGQSASRLVSLGGRLNIFGPGNAVTGRVNAQVSGVSAPFLFSAGDPFTEGEGIAGHPAKWSYRPCRNVANAQKIGGNGMSAIPAAATNSNLGIFAAILFLLWVLN